DNVTFVRAELGAWTPEAPFDALVGRFVLMHQPDPAAALRDASRHVRAGGVVAFLESQMSASVAGAHSWPHSATYERALGWMRAVVAAAGAHADMGLRLRATFLDAGLSAPELLLSVEPQGGPGAPVYRYIAESVRSMAPLLARFGIATPSPADVEDLAATLERETIQANGVLVPPIVVGASARTR
ncbi:MAG: class I SAM-dependent methyltransferase, partial [Longimicrobiales bacterium]